LIKRTPGDGRLLDLIDQETGQLLGRRGPAGYRPVNALPP